nr:hypothetical protein Iba_chr10eCG1850 [Ipomoea batatas]
MKCLNKPKRGCATEPENSICSYKQEMWGGCVAVFKPAMLTRPQSIPCSAWDLASSTSPRASIQPGIPRLGSLGHIATPEASSQSMLSASSISPNRHDRNAVMGKGGCLLKRERRSCVRVLEKEGFAEDLGKMADLGFENSIAVEAAADAIEESVKEIGAAKMQIGNGIPATGYIAAAI